MVLGYRHITLVDQIIISDEIKPGADCFGKIEETRVCIIDKEKGTLVKEKIRASNWEGVAIMIKYHRIIETGDQITIELYLDQQQFEFSKEFLESLAKAPKNLPETIQTYLKEQLPGIKAATINVMLGGMLLTSFPFSQVQVAEAIPNINTVQTQTQAASTYTVQPGDTLYRIAQKFGTTVAQIKANNKLTSDTVYPNQRLIISPSKQNTYTVQPGDTLSKIAQKFGTTVAQIKANNGLTSDIIYPNQQLIISPSQQKTYKVAPGDTLYGIANKYGITVNQIKTANNLSGNNIFPGQTMIIPNPAPGHTVPNPDSLLILVNKNHKLPADYVPDNLVIPQVPFINGSTNKMMQSEAAKALQTMVAQAKKDGINLYGVSGYRSYEYQKDLFAKNVAKYGSEAVANQYSARAGESEHQTGLAMDVTGPSVNYGLSSNFGETPEGKWLANNARYFGFIIRYPQDKEDITGYNYEPWHTRYVGNSNAINIASSQTTLEEYLV